MMKNYDKSVKINHNWNWPYIPGQPYRILIIGGSGSVRMLLSLIKNQWPLYWQGLFICQRSTWIKVSIAY